MREIYGFLRLASRLANPFGHPSQVLVLQTCVDLRQLASPFGEGLSPYQTIILSFDDVHGHWRILQLCFASTSRNVK